MRHCNLLASSAAALLLLLAGPLLAAPQVLQLPPEGTEVTFLLGATGHNVEGTLYLSHGEISFDPETGQASGEVAIDARRSESGNKRRDKAMHKKVLDSTKHPLIVFVPQQLRGNLAESGRSEIELLGTLTLVGREHPFTLPASVERVGADRLEVNSTFTVPYVEWGLQDPSLLFLRVEKEVEVKIIASGSLQASPAPNADTEAD